MRANARRASAELVFFLSFLSNFTCATEFGFPNYSEKFYAFLILEFELFFSVTFIVGFD